MKSSEILSLKQSLLFASAGLLLGLLFNPEDEDSMSLRNVS
jgi:hypothetical protein